MNLFKSVYLVYILFFVAFVFSTGSSFCAELNFKNYTVEDGLISNTVYSIIQDSYGFIWIGTEDGLSRFNGYEFYNYRKIPDLNSSIINNHVYCLFEDKSKKIWVGTEKGICTYDPVINGFIPFNVKTAGGISIMGRIQNIFESSEGDIWFCVTNQGVFRYNRSSGNLKRYSFAEFTVGNAETNLATCLYRDEANRIIASVNNTKYQIYRYDSRKDAFVALYPYLKASSRLSSYSMIEDGEGRLWFGTWNNGLCRVNEVTGGIESYMDSGKDKIMQIHYLYKLSKDEILICSNDGISRFNARTHAFEKVFLSFPDKFVYSFFKDREGGYWFGSYYGGLKYLSLCRNYFKSYIPDKYKNSVSGKVVSNFCEDKRGNLWIGTDDGGLDYFNVKTGKFTVYRKDAGKSGLSGDNIHGLCFDGDDLWIGTYSGGLNVLDTKKGSFKHYYSSEAHLNSLYINSVYSIYKDSHSDMWVGTSLGINLYNRKKDDFVRMMRCDCMVIDIVEFGGKIWFATIGKGLFSYDFQTKKWKNYDYTKKKNALISEDVICLYNDRENKRLWIGTNNGVCCYDPSSDGFRKIDIHTPSLSIRNLLMSKNILWITTSKGLLAYNIKNGLSRIYNETDGLLSDEFNQKSGIKISDGHIFIGTAKGFNSFCPDSVKMNKYVPPVVLGGIQLFNQPANINDYMRVKGKEKILVLPYNKNSIIFEYSALSYFAPEKNQYAFMLKGFDKSWNYVGNQKKATYTNLSPGTYYFKVKASNNDGVWNNKGLTLKVIIKRPLWLSNFALFLYSILIIGIVVGLYKYMEKLKKKKELARLNRMKREKEREAYNSKIEFFTAIAHEIRTPVNLITGPVEKILEKDNLDEDLIKDLNIIDRNSQELLSLTNQILDFRKIEENGIHLKYMERNVNDILKEIYGRFKLFLESKRIDFSYISDNVDFTAKVDVENLTKVVDNLLSNAIKFTKDKVELELITDVAENGMFRIKVSDNGIGIAEEERENILKPFYRVSGNENKPGTGLGLYLVHSIVHALNGSIEIESRLGEGSAFILTIPDHRDDFEEVQKRSSMKETETYDYSEKEETASVSPAVSTEDKFASVLIVEDNDDLVIFLTESLSDEYVVYTAKDGVEGLKMLEKNDVDIIISDIMMPHMDGLEFCRKVKFNALWSHIPLVLLTAKTSMISRIEAMEKGADAYIDKPFSLKYLKVRIKNLLDSRKNLIDQITANPFLSSHSIAGNSADEEFISKVVAVIDKNISNMDFTMDNLSDELCISSSGLYAKIKSLMGVTPNKMLLHMRLKKAADLLSQNKYRVNEVCFMVGFNNPSYFAKCFHNQFGVYPKDYRTNKNQK